MSAVYGYSPYHRAYTFNPHQVAVDSTSDTGTGDRDNWSRGECISWMSLAHGLIPDIIL